VRWFTFFRLLISQSGGGRNGDNVAALRWSLFLLFSRLDVVRFYTVTICGAGPMEASFPPQEAKRNRFIALVIGGVAASIAAVLLSAVLLSAAAATAEAS